MKKKVLFYIFIISLLATSNVMSYLLYYKLQKAKEQIVLVNSHIKSNYGKLGIALDGEEFISLIEDKKISYLNYLEEQGPEELKSSLSVLDDLVQGIIDERIQLATYIKQLGTIFSVPRIEEKKEELLIVRKGLTAYTGIYDFLQAYEDTAVIHRKTIKNLGSLLKLNLVVANLLADDEKANATLLREKLSALNDNFFLLKKSLSGIFGLSQTKIKAEKVKQTIKELSRKTFIREGFTKGFNTGLNDISERYDFYLEVEQQYIKALDIMRELEEKIEGYQDEIASYKRDLADFDSGGDHSKEELEIVQKELLSVKEKLFSIEATVKVFANIINYDERGGTCTLNRGEKDGVESGIIYDVWRFGQFVCRIKVIEVNETTSKAVVDFATITTNNLPREGDYLEQQ